MCIGRKFALMQLKVVLSYLLRTYDIEFPAKNLPKSNFNTMVVAPVAPVTVKYRKR